MKFGERFFMKEAKYLEKQKRQVEQTTRVAKTTRGDACAAKNKEEGARSRRAVLSSFAKSTKTNEQMKVRMVYRQKYHTTRGYALKTS